MARRQTGTRKQKELEPLPPDHEPHLVGYARVSTADQENLRQRDALIKAGVDPKDIWEDKASGRDFQRPGWQSLWKDIRQGDVVIVHSLDRLGRNVAEIHRVISEMKARGVGLRSLTQSLDTTTAIGMLILGILAEFAQFERLLARERTMHGLAVARAEGRVGGSKKRVTDEQIADAIRRINGGERPVAVAKSLKMARQPMDRRIKALKEQWLAEGKDPENGE